MRSGSEIPCYPHRWGASDADGSTGPYARGLPLPPIYAPDPLFISFACDELRSARCVASSLHKRRARVQPQEERRNTGATSCGCCTRFSREKVAIRDSVHEPLEEIGVAPVEAARVPLEMSDADDARSRPPGDKSDGLSAGTGGACCGWIASSRQHQLSDQKARGRNHKPTWLAAAGRGCPRESVGARVLCAKVISPSLMPRSPRSCPPSARRRPRKDTRSGRPRYV